MSNCRHPGLCAWMGRVRLGVLDTISGDSPGLRRSAPVSPGLRRMNSKNGGLIDRLQTSAFWTTLSEMSSVETAQMSAVETRQMTAAETSVLSQQKTPVLSQENTSVLSQHQILCVSDQASSKSRPKVGPRSAQASAQGRPRSASVQDRLKPQPRSNPR